MDYPEYQCIIFQYSIMLNLGLSKFKKCTASGILKVSHPMSYLVLYSYIQSSNYDKFAVSMFTFDTTIQVILYHRVIYFDSIKSNASLLIYQFCYLLIKLMFNNN